MDRQTTNALFALGGLAVGYLIAKFHLEQQYEDIAADEIRKAKEFYEELYRNKMGDEALPKDVVKTVAKVTTTFEAPEAAAAMVDYQSFFDGRRTTDDTDNTKKVEVVDTPEPYSEEDEMTGTAVLISQEEYNNSDAQYESNTLLYWAGDAVVTDVAGDAIDKEKVSKFLGPTNLDGFLEEPYGGPEVLYVRNHHYQQDFEVHYNSEASTQQVM